MNIAPNKIAGLLYLLLTFSLMGIWYVLLFVNSPPNVNPMDTFHFLLSSETEESVWLWWLLVAFPFLCLAMSLMYFSKLSQHRLGIFSLFGVGFLLALVACMSFNLGLAAFAIAPLIFSFKELGRHLTRHSTGTPSSDR